MKIYDGLGLNIKKREVVSLVGGGGKTTTMFQLGKELKGLNKKVLVTTTTAIFNPVEDEYDDYFLKDIDNGFTPNDGSITVFGEKVEKGKLLGGPVLKLEEIIERNLFDFILIEADGAKKKPIKAPASHEPVVPKHTTKTIGIIGLDCLEKRIEEIVHRPEIFLEIVGKGLQDVVDEYDIIKLVLDDEGLFKGAIGERILLLNKACEGKIILKGEKIRRMLFKEGFEDRIIVADIRRRRFY